MNPWDYILPLLGWILLMFIVFIITLVITGIIQAITRSLKKKSGKLLTMDPERLLDEVKSQAMDKYKDEIIERHEKMIAFVAGAEFVMKQIYSEEQVNVSR